MPDLVHPPRRFIAWASVFLATPLAFNICAYLVVTILLRRSSCPRGSLFWSVLFLALGLRLIRQAAKALDVNFFGPFILSLMTAYIFFGLIAPGRYAMLEVMGLSIDGDEGPRKGNLHSIRNALSIYYGDMEGQYPSDLRALTISGKYFFRELPVTKVPSFPKPPGWRFSLGKLPHSDSREIHFGTAADDRGGWMYDNVVGDSNFGSVWINCTHTDYRGSAWSSY